MDGGQASELTMHQIALYAGKKIPGSGKTYQSLCLSMEKRPKLEARDWEWSGRPGRIPCRMELGRGNRGLQGHFLCSPGFCLPPKAILSFIFKIFV